MSNPTNEKSNKLGVLINEYNYTCTAIGEFINEQFKVLNAGIIIYSAAFAYGFSDDENRGGGLILIFIPIAIIILMNYLLYRLQRNSYLQEYRTYIENEINKEVDQEEPLIFYGLVAKKKLRNNNTLSIILNSIYFLIYGASVWVGVGKLNTLELNTEFDMFNTKILVIIYLVFVITLPIFYLIKIWHISFRTEKNFTKLHSFIIEHILTKENNIEEKSDTDCSSD